MGSQLHRKLYLPVSLVFLLFIQLSAQSFASLPTLTAPLTWTHLSTTTGNLPIPSNSTQQTAALVLDIDQNGIDDFVIGSRQTPGPSLVWYRRINGTWTKYVIDSTVLPIEAGGAYADIDRDGDPDIVMGADSSDNKVWWWENPYPAYNPNLPWTRRLIKNGGSTKHHDQMFGDYDGDGQQELVFWNQHARALQLAELPSDPRTTQPWPFTTIYTWTSGAEHEGLAQADVDGDGKPDIIGGGRWFKHNGGFNYTANLIDDAMRFTRAAVGQLIVGGRPEIVFVCGDCDGPLKFYTWLDSRWVGRDLLGFNVKHGHTLAIEDMNKDGWLDIFVAEMRLSNSNPDAKMWLFAGDGAGNFTRTEIATGIGNHESQVADLDGDGDLDILGKPYNWQTPRLDIWLNGGTCKPALNRWQRHVIDANKPWRSIFVESADLDGDRRKDIVTGGWWYKNPGLVNGAWVRNPIGAPLNNLAALYDFDRDGDIDILGTQGQDAQPNANFSWAQNDGAGKFTIFNNITPGAGDFLQGIGIAQFHAGANLEVALSWHESNVGVQMLTVPTTPANTTWPWRRINTVSQDEALSIGDIDNDRDLDLMLGTKWLRNDRTTGAASGPWTAFTLNNTPSPDRNRLADINLDGRHDVVVGFEAINTVGKLAWYEQPSVPTAGWTEHIIANTVVGPMSLDVKDMDRDGDWDVIIGEHNLANPANAKLYIFENTDGKGGQWATHVVYTGDEHHDGAYVVDLDNDGDLDIVSIGWGHNNVIVYENTTTACSDNTGGSPSTVTPTATPTVVAPASPTATVTPTATGPSGCTPLAGNVALNGDFENGTTSWSFYTNAGGSFTTASPAHHCQQAARLQFSGSGNNMQFFQPGLVLEPNTRYRLSFAAYSSSGRNLGVYLHKHTAGYESYGLDLATVDLTTQWQSFTYEFTTRNFTTLVQDGRLRFWFAGLAAAGDTYWIDAVHLHKVSNLPATATTTATPLAIATPTITPTSTGTPTASPTAPASGAGSWWNNQWAYRVPITVKANGAERTDKLAEIQLNFTQLLTRLAVQGAFDPKSLRVIEVDSNGNPVNDKIAFQFDPASNYNATTNAVGTLVFMLTGATTATGTRSYHVYFDLTGKGFTAPTFTPLVTLTDNVADEGQSSYRINTAVGTYFYQKQAAGFSSLHDTDNNDWLNYRPTGGAGGSYRGIPNLIYPEGKFHPGDTSSTSTILGQGPLKITVRSITNDSKWEALWEFYPTYARMTLLKHDHNYWFLYEGTPGGTFDPATDFVVRSDGAQNLVSASWTGDLNGPEWVYFADPTADRSLFIVNHTQDTLVDSYRPMSEAAGSMTVFGFGREGTNSFLTETPKYFTVGLMDTVVHNVATKIINNAYLALIVESGQPQINGVIPPPTATPAATATQPAAATSSPTATPTTTATATPTVTPTPTATVTPTATGPSGCTPLAGNVALNGDFENGTTSWSFYTNAGGSFTTASPAHHCQQAARLQFSGSGSNMQFFQSGLVLEPNTRYRLSFAAYSSSGRNLGVYLHKHTAGYESYGLDLATVDLTTQWQSFTYEFTTRNFTTLVQDGRLRFWFAGLAATGDTYWIDAVHLHKVSNLPATATPTVTATAPPPTSTPPATPTASPVAAMTPTAIATPTATATQPVAETAMPSSTATETLAAPMTATLTSSPTATPTATATPTVTPMETPTVTPTATETDGCTPLGSNVALNGDFENGTTSWSFYTNAGGSFTMASPAHHCQQAARLQFSGSGSNMQFFQSGLVLEPNTRYRLSFAAYSSSGRNLGVYLHKHTAGYGSYGLDLATVDLTTQWQSFTYEFTTRNFTTLVQDGRLRFWFAGLAAAGDTYWIDAVHLYKVAGVTNAALAEAGEPLSETVTLPAFALVQGSEQPTVTVPVAIHGLITQLVDDGITQSDQPAAGITVQVYVDMLAGGTLVTSLTTDANGGFVIPELPAGLYTLLIVPPPGYTAAQPDFIERNAETTMVIHVALQPLRQLYLPLVAR